MRMAPPPTDSVSDGPPPLLAVNTPAEPLEFVTIKIWPLSGVPGSVYVVTVFGML